MVEQKVSRSGGERGCHFVACGREKSPGRGEFRAEEYSAVQLDSAQDLRECIHLILNVVPQWTVGKVPWPQRKVINLWKPFEQVKGTLGHGGPVRSIAQLQYLKRMQKQLI